MANIFGTTGNDALTGTAGDDTINALTGFDDVDGGAGQDRLTIDYSTFKFYSQRLYSSLDVAGGALSGMIESRVSNDFTTFRNIEQLVVTLGLARDLVIVNSDGALGSRTVSIDAGGGADELSISAAGAGSVTFTVAADGTVETSLGGSYRNFESYSLWLGAGRHAVQTGAFDDRVQFVGGTGTIRTGAGDDVILLKDAIATIDAGEGTNDYLRLDLSSATYNCRAVINGLTGTGSAGARTGTRTTFSGVELFDLSFGAGDDSLQLSDVTGFDVRTGAGADTFVVTGQSSGNLDGGSGSDRATIDLSGLETGLYTLLQGDGAGGLTGAVGLYSGVNLAGIERLDLRLGNLEDLVEIDGSALAQGAWVNASGGGGVDVLSINFAGLAKVSAVVGTDGVLRAAGSTFSSFEQFKLTGSAGADVLTGGAFGNTIDGGSGNDRIRGGAGNDTLIGGEGNDLIYSMGGEDELLGGAGNDTYYLESASGVILTEYFDEGIDTVITSAGGFLNDNFERLTLTGTAVYGSGNDLANTITGNAGFNVLRGYGGNDTISGGEGQDIIWGGTGADVLTGGAGADTFGFDSLETAKERDVIRDFTAGSDSLVFDRTVFTALGGSASNGALDANNFVLGKKAMTAEQHLIYDQASGALFYDADGLGGMAQVQIATLSTKPVLGPGDIFLL